MTVANRLKFTVAITSAATITPPASPNVTGMRVLAQSIAAGDVAANTTNVPLTSEDASGNWEESYYTVSADGLSFVRTSVAASSAGGTTPATFTGTVTVYCTMFADYVNKLVTSANTVDVATLTNITPTTGHKVLLIDPNTGLMYTALVSAILALSGAAPAAATAVRVSVSAPSTVIGSPVTVTVTTDNPLTGSQTATVTLAAPMAGTWSTNPVTVNATTGTVTPTFTPSAAGSGSITATASGTPTLTAGSVAYAATASAPAATITANNPASPQTVGTSFIVTGNWTGTQPTALDVLLTDSGTAGAWNSVTTGLVINANGTYQFTATPTVVSASRTLMVRSYVSGTVVATSAATTAYVVNAGVPATMAAPVATPGDTTASIAYSVPAANGSAITGYTVTPYIGATAQTAQTFGVGAGPITVTGLTDNTAYTFKMHGNNGVGPGVDSPASNSVTPAVAGTPNYILTPDNNGFPTATTAMAATTPDKNANYAVNIYVKTADGTGTPAANAIKFVWGKSPTVAPMAYADAHPTAGVNGQAQTHSNDTCVPSRVGNWPTQNAGLFGLYGVGSTLYAWGTPGNWYLWVLTSDGFAKAYDNNTGTPIAWVLT